MRPNFDGVLFFPVTPFTESGAVDLDAPAAHLTKGLEAGPGGIFIACGPGEFHDIDEDEFRDIVTNAVKDVPGPGPVDARTGGSVAPAQPFADPPQAPGPP